MYTIERLPKDKWEGFILPIGYTTEDYYDVSVIKKDDGFTVDIVKKKFDSPVTHYPEEFDFPDKLYAPYWENAEAYGIFIEDKIVGCIELFPEKWSNRLRVTELWVDADYRSRGIGHALIEHAIDHAAKNKFRAVMLETQSCNVNAVDFYIHEGFTLIGFNACEYDNYDLERKEVRLEMGILL